MVVKRNKAILQFIVFLLPASVVYFIFFIFPFFQGIQVSLTNWDGLSSKSPISMEKASFESKILDRVQSSDDKAFLLKIYRFDPDAQLYKRLELTGSDRSRVLSILGSAGYEPDNYKFIGLQNYLDIFSGKANQSFYPRFQTTHDFNEYSPLPDSFSVKLYETALLEKLTDAGDKSLAQTVYHKKSDKDGWTLDPAYNELDTADKLRFIPGMDPDEVETLLSDLGAMGSAGRRDELTPRLLRLKNYEKFSVEQKKDIELAAGRLFDIGHLKKLMGEKMVREKLEMGVLGFTIFFTVLNVILTNLLAFLLALALDKKLRTRNALRSVFFLPNILSLVIVAFIWSLIFGQLLPKITGVDVWMGSPDLAPYLVVLVSVWQGCGYLMVIYLAGLQSIPQEILEVASVDGAGPWKRLWNVTIPLLIPAFTICMFLSLSNSLKAFDIVFALVGPSGYATGTVPVVMDIFYDAFSRNLAGLGSAKAIVLMVFILILTGIQLSIMKKKEVQY